MNLLPKWALANQLPAIHDFESLTVLEQTARIYGAMQSMIGEYNKFADDVNRNITEFQCSMEKYLVLNLDITAANYLNSAINEGRINLVYDPETENLNFEITGVDNNE